MILRQAATFLTFAIFIAPLASAQSGDRFDSNGVEIHFVSKGEGPDVVLLHGFSGSAEGAFIKPGTFDAIVNAGFRVTAIDHRGHGSSEKPHDPDSYGVEMAEDVRRLLDHLNIDRAHIVGYSMGGKIANTFRSRHADRVISLTLGGYGWPWLGTQVTLAEARDNLQRRIVLPGNDLDALAAYSVRSNDLVPSAENLFSNTVPTLSIVGTEDQAVPKKDLQELRQTMSDLKPIDMPGTHAGPDGALYKKQFADEIIAFLKQHETH